MNKTLNRVLKFRKSPVYRVLEVLPTPARPWLLALDAFETVRRSRQKHRYERRENKLMHQLSRARAHQPRKRKKGGGLGRLILMGGLAFAASKLMGGKKQGREQPSQRQRERELTRR